MRCGSRQQLPRRTGSHCAQVRLVSGFLDKMVVHPELRPPPDANVTEYAKARHDWWNLRVRTPERYKYRVSSAAARMQQRFFSPQRRDQFCAPPLDMSACVDLAALAPITQPLAVFEGCALHVWARHEVSRFLENTGGPRSAAHNGVCKRSPCEPPR